MKISKKVMCLFLIGLLGTGTCRYVHAAEENVDVIEIEQTKIEESGVQNSDMTENEDPGTARYQGNVPEGFYDDSGIQTYSQNVIHDSRFDGYTIKKGIDVSQWNGSINWKNVKNAGIEFAFIRGAYRGYGAKGTLVKDTTADYNFEQSKKSGVPVGAYIFSQAITEAEAIEEANYLLDIVDGYDISLPLVLDFEYASDGNGLTGRLYNANLSVSKATSICRAFCKTIEEAGYTAMVYANKDMLENDLNADQLSKDYKIWLAHYTSKTNYKGDYNFWQFTSTGKVSGISGNVDINYWYIEQGQSKQLIQSNGQWLYYLNGVFQSGFTGLEKIDSKWYYIQNGKWQSSYTGLVKYSSGTQYYVKGGIIQHGFTGLVKLSNAWYYIVAGKLNSEYTGLVKYTSGIQYYVENGIIQHGFTGLLKLENKWCYISNGRYIPNYTGLAEYSTGSRYYMENGVIQYGFTGLIKLDNIWYYIADGKWQSDYTGLVAYSSGTRYYVKEGTIRHDFSGLIKLEGFWYYIVGGRWQSNFTGLAKYSTGSWYYVDEGIINYSYTGLVRQGSYTYYVENGKWLKYYNGTVNIDGAKYKVSEGIIS